MSGGSAQRTWAALAWTGSLAARIMGDRDYNNLACASRILSTASSEIQKSFPMRSSAFSLPLEARWAPSPRRSVCPSSRRRQIVVVASSGLSRREALSLWPKLAIASAIIGPIINPAIALAFSQPPPGLRRQNDKLDGYSFLYPESWLPVTSSGNDIFFRNPRNIDENVFVDITSPSSSRCAWRC